MSSQRKYKRVLDGALTVKRERENQQMKPTRNRRQGEMERLELTCRGGARSWGQKPDAACPRRGWCPVRRPRGTGTRAGPQAGRPDGVASEPPLRDTVRSLRSYRKSLDNGPQREPALNKVSSRSIAYMFWPQKKPVSLKSITAFLKSNVCESLRHRGMTEKKKRHGMKIPTTFVIQDESLSLCFED